MTSGYWSTRDRPVREQHAYWREVVCDAFTPLVPLPHPRAGDWASQGVAGWVRSRRVADVNCAEIATVGQVNLHGTREVARTAEATVFVNLQLAGSCVGSQGGRTCHVPAGSFALFDATRPFRLDYAGDWRSLSFRVPRDRLMSLVARPDDVTATTVDGSRALGAVVAGTMRSVWDAVEDLGDAEARAVSSGFTTLLATACGATDEARGAGRRTLAASLYTSVCTHLQDNLRNGDLAAARVAAHFGVSVRTLHNVFRDSEHTYAQTVTKLRVDACARDLADPACRESLTALAARWGFFDLSHLNRAFRTHRGHRPADLRPA
ncbi:helix-turn-helix domain-containing protein [Pseudonocardia sp. DR1-2]|uniref:AraC-like ligand-binding domain-containing protein n=1 Tax=Pseudonocardia sp. DR1-2 TaxID=2951168 RepID=UPI0020443DB9|nr:helix-turn-helix domain-containing protein [Pseudonocardia sp. DR1-2]MCM3846143.1 helix-turn-helix domain-containing protein [Pseudonocardia sp. DR1-2]